MEDLKSELKSELKYAWEELALIYKVCDKMIYQRGVREIANFFLSELIELLQVKGGLVALLDENWSEMVIVASSGIDKNIGSEPIQIGKGMHGKIVNRKYPEIITKYLENDPLFKLFPFQIGSLLSIPMISGEKTIGVIGLWDKIDGSKFTERELNFVLSLGIFVGVAIENTRLYQDLEKAHNNLKLLGEAERLRLVSMLSNAVAHQMRNPLENMSLAMMSLKTDMSNINPEVEEDIKDIDEEIERLSSIINNFLEFSRPSKEPCIKKDDLNILLDKTIAIVEGTAKFRNIKIVRKFDHKIPLLLINIDQMKEVFLNLILNAQEAMSKGGKLTITTKTDTDNIPIIIIEDTGVGIPEERIREIFNPFYTTKAEGFGIGLVVVERIIREHNGSIEVKSEVGKGTTFKIKLKGKEAKE
ncbi:MAG: ATP-binding protein [bacterium]